uniref:Uncharacterized protein n=1 Tax=Arundo donax TaxID=35708 RepID=A0A0A9G020_ARUDO
MHMKFRITEISECQVFCYCQSNPLCYDY